MGFGFRKPHFFGIDFGTSAIKAIELTEKNGKPSLLNYGFINLSAVEKGVSRGTTYDKEIAIHLQALLERLKPQGTAAHVALPAFIGLMTLIELPSLDESELEEAIQYEAHKYIPTSLDEVALSWEVVGKRSVPGEGEKLEVLLVAALNKEINRYESFAREAGLTLDFLELETFSIVRSLVGREEGMILVIDIGSRATNLVLVDNGIVKVSRNLNAGGSDITHVIMESLDISEDRAEELKKSGKDFLNQPTSALVFPALDMIASEAERIIASYRAKYPDRECKRTILSGGTAELTGLLDSFGKRLKMPVSIGNPWQSIEYPPELEPVIRKLGTSFSVAIGLALNGIESEKRAKTEKESKKFSLKDFFKIKIH